MIDFFEHLVDSLKPHKWLRILVVRTYLMLNGFNQSFDAFENSPSNPFASDFAEPALTSPLTTQ